MTQSEDSLARSFFDLPKDEQAVTEDFEFIRSLYGGRGVSWDDLLQSDRVLIISEAGMGKTFECQAQQRRLFADGEPAFFIELATLTDADPANDFDPEARRRYDSWKDAQTERAYFFLDSIDELKLTAVSFELALQRLARHLGPENLGRACIVLTTRPGSDDREAVARLLPVPPVLEYVDPVEFFADVAMRESLPKNAVADAVPSSRFVALAALDEAQQRDLATKKGVTDPGQLLAAIEAAHAEEFAKRPLDFIDLCGDWNANKRIRAHGEQLESSITLKLMPPPRGRLERADLSPAKAREGAERLALAALMMRKFVIWQGTDDDRARGDNALDPRKVLSTWSDPKVRALLQRGLFGFASYGRVRFHNRLVIEYLAAKRLEYLVSRGLSTRALHRLLFATSPVGYESIRPTMEPVAAWLAPGNESVRAEILRRDPSVLLRFADPGALSVAQRAQALRRYVAVYGQGGWRGLRVPALQARRLALPALAGTINELWLAGIENPEVRESLLEVVEAGRISACADIAYAAATNPQAPDRERVVAVQALAAVDDARLVEVLDEMAAQHPAWSKELTAAVIVHAFSSLTVPQLLGALRTLTYEKRQVGGAASYLSDAIAKANFIPAQLEALRAGLSKMIAADLRWDENKYRLRSARFDLVKALRRVCELQLADGVSHAGLCESIAMVLQLSKRDDYYDDESKELRAALNSRNAAVRQAVFWAQDRLLTAKMTGRAADDRICRVLWAPAMQLTAERDTAWLHADLADGQRAPRQRRTALEALLLLANETADRIAALKALRPALTNEADLAARLEEMVTAFENPPKPDKYTVERKEYEAQQRRKKLKARASWIEFCRELLADDEKRLGEKRVNTAVNLAEWLSHAPHEDGYIGWNRGLLERAFGKAKVDRLRELFMAVWREVTPTLESERDEAERHLYYNSWRAGLVGVYAEAEDTRWARRLDGDLARLAMRYALTSPDGVPKWVEDLATLHPEIVREMMQPVLEAQLADEKSQHASLLHYITNTGPHTLKLFIAPVRTWLMAQLAVGSPSMHRVDKFERAIDLVLEHGDAADAASIEQAARMHLRSNADDSAVLFWLPLLMRLAPQHGVAELERLTADVAPGRSTRASQWLGALFGHRAHRSAFSPALQADPALLSRLTLLAYQHIRIDDDDIRETMRENSSRSDAEFARSQLVSALLATKGPEAWRIKLEFARDTRVKHFSDRVVALAKQGMAAEWDAPVFDLSEVLALEKSLDLIPVTRADMAALVRDRLDELEDSLLEDDSQREAWSEYRIERLLRRAIAQDLKARAHDAYLVTQEAVTGDEKETDLRLRSAGHPIEAVIELKIGENGYTVEDFRSALSNQLVGKYMLPEARRVGCLMISVASSKQWDHPDDGRRIGIDEVVDLLRADAARLVETLGHESLLEVRKLDLRAAGRRSPKAAKKATKKTTKKVTKETPKKATKNTAKKATKRTAKQAAKKSTRTASKAIGKVVAKVPKRGGSKAPAKAALKATKKRASGATKKPTRNSGKLARAQSRPAKSKGPRKTTAKPAGKSTRGQATAGRARKAARRTRG